MFQRLTVVNAAVNAAVGYCYKLDGKIPDKTCDDLNCARPFHRACLHEWFRGLPDTRQSFDKLFGKCPYCETDLSVKIR